MKLPLPSILFLFVRDRWRTPLPVTAALCLQPQKNQPHWLASFYLTLYKTPLTALFLPAVPLSLRLALSSCLGKLQVASNPA